MSTGVAEVLSNGLGICQWLSRLIGESQLYSVSLYTYQLQRMDGSFLNDDFNPLMLSSSCYHRDRGSQYQPVKPNVTKTALSQ